MAKDSEIEAYEQSLREVGVEIASLNEALIKKSNDYKQLTINSKKVLAENTELRD